MLTSIPTLAALDAHNLWYPSLSSNSYHQSSSEQNHSNQPTRGTNSRSQHVPPRTLLSVLREDENAILRRKVNIQRFGAGWLKPPGVSKTLQGMDDEKAEREEQEAAAAREQALEDERAAARQAEEDEAHRMGMAMEGDDESGIEERDLDDDIPDADETTDWIDEDADDALPTDEGDGDYADISGMDMEGMAEARDLDDDVPEAGSYQHTDTDLEDMTSDDDEDDDDDLQPMPMQRMSIPEGVSIALGSSLLGSSPIGTGARRSTGYRRTG